MVCRRNDSIYLSHQKGFSLKIAIAVWQIRACHQLRGRRLLTIEHQETLADGISILLENYLLNTTQLFNEAKECIEQAESMNGDREYVYYAKACYFALQNEQQEAIKNLKEAIAIAPLRCKQEAKHNPDFDRLRDNPEIK